MIKTIGDSGSTIGFATHDDYKGINTLDLLSRLYVAIDTWRESGGDNNQAKSAETAATTYLEAWRSLAQFRSWAILISKAITDAKADETISVLEDSLRQCGLDSSSPDYYIFMSPDLLFPDRRDALIEHVNELAKNGESVRNTFLSIASENIEAQIEALDIANLDQNKLAAGKPGKNKPAQNKLTEEQQPLDNVDRADSTSANSGTTGKKSDARLSGEVTPDIPFGYRIAFINSPRRCANCEFFKAKSCSYYNAIVVADYVCDSWQNGDQLQVSETGETDETNNNDKKRNLNEAEVHARSLLKDFRPGDKAFSKRYKHYVRVSSVTKTELGDYYQVELLSRNNQSKGTALVPKDDLKSSRAAKEWEMGEKLDKTNLEAVPEDDLRTEIQRIIAIFKQVTDNPVINDSEVLNPLRETIAESLGGPLWVKVDTGRRRGYYRAMQTALSAIGAARQLLFTTYRHTVETGNLDYLDTYEQIKNRVESALTTLEDSLARLGKKD